MEDEMFMSENIIEVLARTRQHLTGSPLLSRLDELLSLELDLSIYSAEKVKGDLIKEKAKDNVRPLGNNKK
jgi:hypothetical protein